MLINIKYIYKKYRLYLLLHHKNTHIIINNTSNTNIVVKLFAHSLSNDVLYLTYKHLDGYAKT